MASHNSVTFNKYPKGTYPTVRYFKSIGEEHPLAFHLGQLRHAYMQLIRPTTGMAEFADGLIAPAIKAIEEFIKEDCTGVQPEEVD